VAQPCRDPNQRSSRPPKARAGLTGARSRAPRTLPRGSRAEPPVLAPWSSTAHGAADELLGQGLRWPGQLHAVMRCSVGDARHIRTPGHGGRPGWALRRVLRPGRWRRRPPRRSRDAHLPAAYMQWAVDEVLSYSPYDALVIPARLPVLRRSWDGLQGPASRLGHRCRRGIVSLDCTRG